MAHDTRYLGNRRDFLREAMGGFGGLALTAMLAADPPGQGR